MTRRWISACVAAGFAGTVALGAQSNPSPANAAPQDAAKPAGIQQPAQAKPANTVTISGCIQDAPMATAEASGRAGGVQASANTTKSFVLNNAMMADANRSASAVGTSGTSSSYRLEGDTALISPHVNHQVRITGTVQASNASATGAANAAAGSTAAGPALRVESVTMVSAKCEEKK